MAVERVLCTETRGRVCSHAENDIIIYKRCMYNNNNNNISNGRKQGHCGGDDGKTSNRSRRIGNWDGLYIRRARGTKLKRSRPSRRPPPGRAVCDTRIYIYTHSAVAVLSRDGTDFKNTLRPMITTTTTTTTTTTRRDETTTVDRDSNIYTYTTTRVSGRCSIILTLPQAIRVVLFVLTRRRRRRDFDENKSAYIFLWLCIILLSLRRDCFSSSFRKPIRENAQRLRSVWNTIY
jgi:hypothetical protein